MTHSEMVQHQIDRNLDNIKKLSSDRDNIIGKMPDVGRGNLTRKSKRDSSGLNQSALWMDKNSRTIASRQKD